MVLMLKKPRNIRRLFLYYLKKAAWVVVGLCVSWLLLLGCVSVMAWLVRSEEYLWESCYKTSPSGVQLRLDQIEGNDPVSAHIDYYRTALLMFNPDKNSWREIVSHKGMLFDCSQIFFYDDMKYWVIFDDKEFSAVRAKLFMTNDGGETWFWSFQNQAENEFQLMDILSVDFSSRESGTLRGRPPINLYTTDGGITWTLEESTPSD